MENRDDPAQVLLTCENCQAQNDPLQKFCSECGFPEGGTGDEKRSFRLTVGSHRRLLTDAHKKVRTAKNIIYVLAGIFIVVGLIRGFVQDNFADMILNVVLSVVFLILAAWCEQNPFGAILTAFIIYVTVYIANGFVNPATLFQGLILKILFIAAFVKGIRSAQEAQVYMKELEKRKAAPSLEH